MKERSLVWTGMILVSGIAFLVSNASAEIPRVISYQGRISDEEGNPVADGTYNMRFRIYDAETGGNLEWDSGVQSVALDGGIFNVLLGDAGQPALDMEFAEEYWLVVTFNGVNQLPRQRLTSVGYAYMASGLVPGTLINGPVDGGAAIRARNTAEDGAFGGRFECTAYNGTGVYGYASATTGAWTSGVSGYTESEEGMAVRGEASATTGDNYGVWGRSASTHGTGVLGSAWQNTGITIGVYGRSSSPDGFAIAGENMSTSGQPKGVYGSSFSSEGGYGVYGTTLNGNGFGVYSAGDFAASGSKSCVVKTSRGPTLMYCQESPENWFEDFGEGRLVNGRCHIELDPLFLETVTIDDGNPMKVFVTPNVDLGSWWVEKDADGFVLRAPAAPAHSPFDYRVVAKRKGFEEKRLDYCRAAESDPYLYEEMREKMIREDREERARTEGERPHDETAFAMETSQ